MIKVFLKHAIFEYAINEFFRTVSDRMNIIDTRIEKFDYDKLLEKWRPVVYMPESAHSTFKSVPERNIKPMLYALEKQLHYNKLVHSGSKLSGFDIQQLALPLIRYVYALDVDIYEYKPALAHTISSELIEDLNCMLGDTWDSICDCMFSMTNQYATLYGVHGFLVKSDSTSASIFM
jgi:hypothetical protein